MNKTLKNSAIYLAGTVIMGLLGFVSTMVLTRVLSQQVYAMYGLFSTFSNAVGMFIAFGYDSAYMRFYYNHGYSQKNFMFMVVKIPLIIFAAIALIIIEPTGTFITYIFGEKLSYFSIMVLLVYLFFHFIQRFFHLTARMEEHAINYVFSNIIAKSGFVVIVFLVYWFIKNVSFDWVLFSFMFTSVMATCINLSVFLKVANEKSRLNESVTDKDLFSYGFPYMINNVLILVIPLIEKLIIRDLAGWEVLSIFTAASIFQTVMMIISNTVINIWNPIVFKDCNDEKKFKPILHTFGLMSVVSVTICLAFCILLRRWLVLLLDSSYNSIYIIAPTIIYSSGVHIISIIYSVGINIKKKTKHLIFIPIVQLVISLILCYMLIPRMGLIGVALASFISLVVTKIYKIYIGLYLYDSGQSEWKATTIGIIGIVIALLSLFFTSLCSDVILTLILIVSVLTVANRELVESIKNLTGMMKISKSEKQ